jgi:hypothetical protein
VDETPRWLACPGTLVVECAPHQAAVVAAQAGVGGATEVAIELDLAGRQRAVVARFDGD